MTTRTYGDLLRTMRLSALIDEINANPPLVSRTLRQFGAVGNGTTDDTDALLLAVEASIAEGIPLTITPGTYVQSATLPITASLVIQGYGRASRLVTDAGAGRFIPILAQSADASAIHGVVLRDFGIDGSQKGQLDAALVQMNNVVGGLLSGLFITGGGTPGESLSSGVAGIAASSGSLIAEDAAGEVVLTVQGCEIAHCTKAGIYAATGVRGMAILANYIHDMAGNGETPGVQVLGGYSTRVIGNLIEDVQGVGILVGTVGGPAYGFARYAKRAIVAQNNVRRSGTGSVAGNAIAVVNGVGQDTAVRGHVLVTDNVCVGGGGGVAAAGILFQNTDDVHARGNEVDGFGSNGVTVQNCRRWSVEQNAITRCNLANQGVGAGVYVGTTGASVTTAGRIAGNQIANATEEGSGHHKYPVYVEPATVGAVSDLVVVDNLSSGSETLEFPAGTWPARSMVRHRTTRTTTTVGPFNLVYAALEAGTVARVELTVTGAQTGAANVAAYPAAALLKNVSGTVSRQGAVVYRVPVIETDTTWGGVGTGAGADPVDITGSGAQAVLTLVAKAATTIAWAIQLEVQTT